ncbi:hypothetical protein NKH33_14550 [Mesorhizobium sp. M1182]|uniref:hypothetical protein n=1 Tax=unclassified Mesorhizobium TaxID=325217 RepID=UPI00333CDFF4
MNLETGKLAVPQWLVLILTMLALVIAAGVFYYYLDPSNVKLVGLAGGIVTGLIVFILTFVTSIRPLQKLDRYEKMGVRGVLANRHDKVYYADLVGGAEKIVRVMGASCTRFVDDFLDMRNEDKVLVDALRKHRRLNVQLLVPEQRHMAGDAKTRTHALDKKLDELRTEFGDRVALRRFPHRAQHSFVIADDDLIAGPIFEGDLSKYAPAVHVVMSTRFAQKYDEHFEGVWKSCAPKS